MQMRWRSFGLARVGTGGARMKSWPQQIGLGSNADDSAGLATEHARAWHAAELPTGSNADDSDVAMKKMIPNQMKEITEDIKTAISCLRVAGDLSSNVYQRFQRLNEQVKVGAPPPSSAVLADAMNIDAINDLDDEDTEAQPSLGDAGASSSTVKRLGKYVHDGTKKPRTALVMQEQIKRIGDIAERSQTSFESFIKVDDEISVNTAMDAVLECGAKEGSDEHYIATALMAKRDNRRIFMHMSVGSRLGWLTRKYKDKYPN
ncbi:hypothetical protein ACQ4PT_056078 [Festuca glaucescens]